MVVVYYYSYNVCGRDGGGVILLSLFKINSLTFRPLAVVVVVVVVLGCC